MKRIMLSVFAAAVTAAWAVPASATDVTFSGQYRVRGEYRNNVDYNDDAADAVASMTQRVRLTANAEAAEDTTVKITLQDTRTFGQAGDGATTGTLTDSGSNNTVDLHEAYLNVDKIFGTPVNFRIGRQELNYGDERLIGAFNWSNNGRAFDGVKFNYAQEGLNVDLFRMTLDDDAPDTDDVSNIDDITLTGVYATLGQIIPNNTIDLYAINKNGNDRDVLNFYTVGVRVKGAVAGLDYSLEVPYQFGEQRDTTNSVDMDLSAWALAAKVGYTIPGAPMNVRIGAEYDYATGDDNTVAGNDEIETFQSLYPTNHNHFGIGDVVNTWSDIQAWSVNVSADVTEKIRLYAAYWSYQEAEANGTDHGSTTGAGADDDLGSEIDLVATYKYSNNVSLEVGAARFMPGDAISDGTTPAGLDDAQDWAYLQITANF